MGGRGGAESRVDEGEKEREREGEGVQQQQAQAQQVPPPKIQQASPKIRSPNAKTSECVTTSTRPASTLI